MSENREELPYWRRCPGCNKVNIVRTEDDCAVCSNKRYSMSKGATKKEDVLEANSVLNQMLMCYEASIYSELDTHYPVREQHKWDRRKTIKAILQHFQQEQGSTKKDSWLLNIAIVLETYYPEVMWDRCSGDEYELTVFGWLDREDSYKDYVELVFKYGEIDTTSTSSAEMSRVIADRAGFEHTDCKRVEELFDIKNVIRLGVKETKEKTYTQVEVDRLIREAVVKEWDLIHETLHSANLVAEVHISKARGERLESLSKHKEGSKDV